MRSLKNVFLVVACISFVLGCSISNLLNRHAANTANESKPLPTPEVKVSPSVTPTPSVSPSVSTGVVSTLKKSAGKYPYEIKLLENAELKARLNKLLGRDWPDMKANWNVETPMAIENGILLASACQAHNCAANRYVMFVDLDKDNVNVYHVEEDKDTKTYFEKGKIELPKKFEEAVGGKQ
jgi:hypothetical protein